MPLRLAIALLGGCLLSPIRPLLAIEPADPHSQFVGGKPVVLVVSDFGKYWRGPERESLRKISALHPIVPSWWLKDLPAQIGVEADAVERISLVMQPTISGIGVAGMRPVTIVTFAESQHVDALLAKMISEPEKKVVGERTVLRNDSIAACRVVDRSLLIGTPASVEGILSGATEKLDEAWLSFLPNYQRTLLAAIQIDFTYFAGGLQSLAGRPPFAPLLNAQRVRITLDVDKANLRITLRGEFADAAAATKAVDPLKAVAAGFDGYLQSAAVEFPKMLAVQATQYPRSGELSPILVAAIEAVRKAIAKAEIKSEGSAAELTLNVATDTPATDAFLLLTLMPRAAKQPGEK